jgi:hypothetical protein
MDITMMPTSALNRNRAQPHSCLDRSAVQSPGKPVAVTAMIAVNFRLL